MTIPLKVYAPAVGTGILNLTITGPGDDPTTEAIEATQAGDVKIYGATATDMVSMPLALNARVSWWARGSAANLVPGYNAVTWYATVAEGALVGNYPSASPSRTGTPSHPLIVSVSAPESHGEAAGRTTKPIATITPVGTLSSTATFELAADETDVTFECMLTTNGAAGAWEACTSPKTYSGLQPATYIFSARATDAASNVTLVVSEPWTVTPADTGTPPTGGSSSSGSSTGGPSTTPTAPQAPDAPGSRVRSAAPQRATTRTAQTARIRAQASGRYPVGTVIVLARQPVKTSAGVTVRWRATTETRKMCTVRRSTASRPPPW